MSIKDFSLGQAACIDQATQDCFEIAQYGNAGGIELYATVKSCSAGDYLVIMGTNPTWGWLHSSEIFIRDKEGRSIGIKNIEENVRYAVYRICKALEHFHIELVAEKLGILYR